MATLDQAVAKRVQELRTGGGFSQDQFARACNRAGLPWPRTRVGQLESGDMTASVGLLFQLTLALSDMLHRNITIAELLPPGLDITLPTGATFSSDAIRSALSGEPVPPVVPQRIGGVVSHPKLDPGWGQVEDKAVEVLALEDDSLDELRAILRASRRLYGGNTGTEERDELAGADATPQRKGRLTRKLVESIVAAVREEQGGSDTDG